MIFSSPIDFDALTAERICIIKPSALGDIVQTLPLLPILRERFPSAKISWVVASHFADLLADHPYLDEVILFHRKAGPWAFAKLLWQLRRRQFDLVFDLQGLLRTGVMTWATRARCRVGLETAREGSAWMCHGLIPESSKHVPAHSRNWRVAEAFGFGEYRRETYVAISKNERAHALDLLSSLGPRKLVIHPGAQWETKRWPVGQFAFVAAKAVRLFGMSPVIVGSPAEQPLCDRLEYLIRKFVPSVKLANLAGKTTLRQLAAVLEHSELVLSNDSGPMHLAAGLGRPVVAAFTCTSSERSGPPGDHHALVSTNLACGAGYHKTCPHRGADHMACHAELEAGRVWLAMFDLLQRSSTRRRAAA